MEKKTEGVDRMWKRKKNSLCFHFIAKILPSKLSVRESMYLKRFYFFSISIKMRSLWGGKIYYFHLIMLLLIFCGAGAVLTVVIMLCIPFACFISLSNRLNIEQRNSHFHSLSSLCEFSFLFSFCSFHLV